MPEDKGGAGAVKDRRGSKANQPYLSCPKSTTQGQGAAHKRPETARETAAHESCRNSPPQRRRQTPQQRCVLCNRAVQRSWACGEREGAGRQSGKVNICFARSPQIFFSRISKPAVWVCSPACRKGALCRCFRGSPAPPVSTFPHQYDRFAQSRAVFPLSARPPPVSRYDIHP